MNKQWSTVAERIAHDDAGKVDFISPIREVAMSNTGHIIFPTGNTMREQTFGKLIPNDHALGQLASRVGIPSRYARKCFEEDPSLLEPHFNHWKEKVVEDVEGDKGWLLRAKGDMLRGVLSDRYSKLDNEFIFGALGSTLANGDVVDVKNFDLNDKYLNLRLVFPQLTHNIGTSIKRDDVMVGIHVTNSEVGSSSLRIDSCLFRLVCTNGLIARVGGESLMQQRHVHLTNREMQNRVADAISEALRAGDGIVETFAKSREVKVESPLDVLRDLAKKEKYSKDFTDHLEGSFHVESGETAFHVVNALTLASQKLPMERRLEVEKTAGRVLHNFVTKGKA